MKSSSLFKNRNIYFLVLVVAALLLAGGLWQYRSYLDERRAQLELQKNFEENQMEENRSDTALQIIPDDFESTVDEGQDATEVSKSSSKKLESSDLQKTTTTKPDEGKSNSSEKATSAVKMEEPKLEAMVIPVFGTAYTEFSDTALIYSKTLDQWTTHTGLDIKAEEGSPVRAAMDGIVEELKNDPELGLTVILNHGGDVFTKYCNLSTLDLVTVGQKVKKGDVISGVGKTALYEIADDPHLHFEVMKAGKSVDPKNYLPKQSLKK